MKSSFNWPKNLADLYPCDRTLWENGPWDNEPDYYEFIYKDYPCFAARNNWGAWCGYVGIDPKSKLALENFMEIPLSVYGGIAYRKIGWNEVESKKDYYWIGFDCNHVNDITPETYLSREKWLLKELKEELKNKYNAKLAREIKKLEKNIEEYPDLPRIKSFFNPTYKTLEFVINEIKELVDQIIEEENK